MTQYLKQIVEKEAEMDIKLNHPNEHQYNVGHYKGFIKGANFALTLNRWVDVNQELPDFTDDVLFLMQDGNIVKGFRNVYGELMIGNQGRFASRHTDIENPITHWMPPPVQP